MPEKAKHRAFFFHLPFHHGHHDHRPSSSSSSPAPAAAPASPVHTFSATMMEENTSDAEEIITASPGKKQTPEKAKHRSFFHSPFHHGHHDHRPSSSSSSPAPAAAPVSPVSPVHTFSATMMEENTNDAEEIIPATPGKKQLPEKAKHRSFFHSPFHHGHHDHRPSSSSSSPAPAAAPASPVHTFSATMMEDNINDAEEIITRWDPQQGSSHAKVTSLFRESREEAPQFLRAVADLQRAMNFFVGGSHSSSSALLVRAHTIMEAAMRRLQKEFYQMLAANRDRLDPESSISGASDMSSLSLNSSSSLSDAEEEETSSATESVGEVERASTTATADLRSIAECMVSSGYGKECVKIYRLVRRSIVDEALYKLGFEKLSPTSNPHKLHEWDAVLDIRIRNWLAASKVAVRTLFSGERVLCDQVFSSSSDSICQSCFAEISAEPATQLFKFPETVVASKKIKISPENMFRILDMYDCISELWPDVDSIFSYQSTAAVRSQANASLLRLGGAVRSTLVEFESAIQRDNQKAAVPGGGLHPLSRYVMNYLAFLADYSSALEDIFAEHPLQAPSTTALPAPLFDDMITSNSAPSSPSSSLEEPCWFMSPVSARIAWLILVLLCKLDSKAELYTEAAMAYLFLANNLHYVVNKVRRSRLLELLGENWVAGHEAKARGYAASYERLAWTNVQAAIPDDPAMDAQAAREHMRRFNEAFEGTCRAQAGWAVEDGKMREQLKLSIAGKLLPAYRQFYERSRLLLLGEKSSPAAVRFSPEDIANYLSDLFCGGGAGDGSSVSSVPGSSVSGSSERSSRFM